MIIKLILIQFVIYMSTIRKTIFSFISKRQFCVKSQKISWFPKNFQELNESEKKTFKANVEFKTDHPGYKDENYIRRRRRISEISNSYNLGEKIPIVEYTKDEHNLWKFLYSNLDNQHKKYACEEYIYHKNFLVKEKILSPNEIPQMETLNEYFNEKSDWHFRPVDGMLTERQFLNGLAFRVFYSTQYIRHTTQPFFTPEPDILHEYLGHAPQFADREICDLNQEIGIASLGASDDLIRQLSAIYWYTIEFGLCFEKGQKKIYGAGTLGCYDEIDWCLSGKPEIRIFNLEDISQSFNYPLMELQKLYFICKDYKEWKKETLKYLKKMKKFVVLKNDGEGNLSKIQFDLNKV